MGEAVAILLAAGESRRMGQLKALLPWQGDTLLGCQVSSLLQAGIHQVVVVLGHKRDRLLPLLEGRERVVSVFNPDYQEGKTTSIKTGIKAVLRSPRSADAQTLVLLNVDQPRTSETISTLLSRHESSDCLITIPVFQGKGGHPLILDCSLLPELLEIAEASQGIRAVVRKHEERLQRVEVDNPEVLWDLNTPEQYQAAVTQ
ncbi:MAG: nucleotidyltransferase family protein [Chloroflexi bacterium]|nr:nucleotidyltransferase family protein [Chloroflexota bacterium]